MASRASASVEQLQHQMPIPSFEPIGCQNVDDWRPASGAVSPTMDMPEGYLSEVAQLLDLDGVVGERADEVVPPATQSLVPLVARLHGYQARFHHHLRMHRCSSPSMTVPLAGDRRGVHVPRRAGPPFASRARSA
jgi:hypothetical protein